MYKSVCLTSVVFGIEHTSCTGKNGKKESTCAFISAKKKKRFTYECCNRKKKTITTVTV